MDELDSKLRNLEELEAARAKEAWEKHVVIKLNFRNKAKQVFYKWSFSKQNFLNAFSQKMGLEEVR